VNSFIYEVVSSYACQDRSPAWKLAHVDPAEVHLSLAGAADPLGNVPEAGARSRIWADAMSRVS